MNKLSSLIDKAKEYGMSGLAITNHDNLSEVIEINRAQKKLRENNDNFTLAIGNEIYLIDKYVDDDSVRQKYYHFILIAKDKIGYQALVELSSRAWYRSSILRGRRRVPTEKIDIEEIITPTVKGHVVAATACLGGEMATHILNNDFEKAKTFINWCIKIFGKEDFYLEMQPSKSQEQKIVNNFIQNYCHETNTKAIITTDAHYLTKEDFPVFEAFLRSQEEKREVKEYYDFARLMTEDEILNLCSEMELSQDFIAKCLTNTNYIQSQIEFYDLAQTQVIPKVPLPDIKLTIPKRNLDEALQYPTLNWAFHDVEEGTLYCIRYCLNSLYQKGLWSKKYLERLEEEFEVHKYQSDELHSNFFNYVNCCQWLINLAWSIDCAVGPARGSAGGCLINFLMDVTQIDPIQYDLKFWRYLNKVRTSPLNFIRWRKIG